MSAHKGDIQIGERAAMELLEIEARSGVRTSEQIKALGLDRKVLYEWQHGATPSGAALQRMALAGYDVMYILTGRRTA